LWSNFDSILLPWILFHTFQNVSKPSIDANHKVLVPLDFFAWNTYGHHPLTSLTPWFVISITSCSSPNSCIWCLQFWICPIHVGYGVVWKNNWRYLEKYKFNTNEMLERFKIHPKSKVRMNILLCWMITMSIGHHVFKIDVLKMK
jgi:hypothetical protein